MHGGSSQRVMYNVKTTDKLRNVLIPFGHHPQGLLALEGELTPILVQMVKSANTNGLLDGEGKTSKAQIV